MDSRKYRRSPNLLHSEVGADVVALHVEHGLCYGMEDVTAEIWRLLAEPTSLHEICSRLVEQYDVSPDQCRSDVAALLSEMEGESLIEPVA